MIFFPSPCVNEIMGFLFYSILSFRFNDLFFVMNGMICSEVVQQKWDSSEKLFTVYTTAFFISFSNFHLIYIIGAIQYIHFQYKFYIKMFLPGPERSLI